jgi:hypothetical protein
MGTFRYSYTLYEMSTDLNVRGADHPGSRLRHGQPTNFRRPDDMLLKHVAEK